MEDSDSFLVCRSGSGPAFYSIVDCDNPYVQDAFDWALERHLSRIYYKPVRSLSDLPDPSLPIFQYREYERLDFEHILLHPSTSLANAYIIRKALTRKHYLSNTVSNWVSKYPNSILQAHFKPTTDFELDYVEFLDEALLEAYELRESLAENKGKPGCEREWWILKAGMSDGGQGIRLFSTEDELREIFEGWEADEPDDEYYPPSSNDASDDATDKHGVITSQLRHFVAQPYIDHPLILPSSSGRKFHIRTYVLAVGALKVYVFREMLALFAAKSYCPPWIEDYYARDLARHLSNTCFQEGGSSNEGSVRLFGKLDQRIPGLGDWKESVFNQICAITGETFEAAARGMMVHFQTIPNAFELFGIDFLVDESGTAWLLEVNAFPDFAQTGDELKEVVVGRLFEETIEVAVKPFFRLGGSESGSDNLKLVLDANLGRNF